MAKVYVYRGNEYSMTGLVELSGLSEGILYRRINKEKWSVEDAVETPKSHRQHHHLEPGLGGKRLVVTFVRPIASVIECMQPRLHKEYVAEPSSCSSPASRTKIYYVITLDNGKPLIVYPDEFAVVREVS